MNMTSQQRRSSRIQSQIEGLINNLRDAFQEEDEDEARLIDKHIVSLLECWLGGVFDEAEDVPAMKREIEKLNDLCLRQQRDLNYRRGNSISCPTCGFVIEL